MIFGEDKREKAVKELVREYCELLEETVGQFAQMLESYIDWDSEFKAQSKRVHKMESRADEIQMEIGKAFYEGAFLPAYREDYVALLETLDRVANKAEAVGDTLSCVRPDIPEEIRQEFVRIAKLTVEAFEPVPDAVMSVLKGECDVEGLAVHVGKKEQEVDGIQFETMHTLFRELEIDRADAMLVKMLLDQACSVSDRIENVSDRLTLIAIKRRI